MTCKTGLGGVACHPHLYLNWNMKYNSRIFINIAEINVGVLLHHAAASVFFRDFIPEKENLIYPACINDYSGYTENDNGNWIEAGLDKTGIAIIRRDYGEDQFNAQTEFETLVIPVSDAMMFHHRAIFHGAAFIWEKRAWIFAAPSGTGKTTQYRNWKKLWKDEVEVICGDKPILCFGRHDTANAQISSEAEKDIIVYPSPWPGKEGYGGKCSAPLAGIIFLERGDRNSIRRMSKAEAVIPLFGQWFTFARTEEQINCLCDLEEELLGQIPVWKLTNVGDEDSAQLTRHVLEKYLRETASDID